jgi:hypothetical protein
VFRTKLEEGKFVLRTANNQAGSGEALIMVTIVATPHTHTHTHTHTHPHTVLMDIHHLPVLVTKGMFAVRFVCRKIKALGMICIENVC